MKKINLPLKWLQLLSRYYEHLQHVAGLAPQTCQGYVASARNFLTACKQKAKPRFGFHLPRTAVIDYLSQLAETRFPGTVLGTATSLRCFFRFLVFEDILQLRQVPVVPALSSRGYLALCEPLSESEVRRFLSFFDRRTVQGRRSFAAAMCLSRLGLRIGEVVGLRLQDINWRKAILRVHCGKGRWDRLLPLEPHVRDALAAYLRFRRPVPRLRAVFVNTSGCRPLSKNTLSQQITQALQQALAGQRRASAHLLRHTLAAHLFQQGATLKEVADLLGHRNLETTQRYIRLTPAQLQLVVQPWPKEAP